jgi:chemotaxis protein MotB
MVVVLAALCAGGCVTKAEHEALQRQLDASKKALTDEQARWSSERDELQADNVELEEALAEERGRIEDYERQIATLQEQLDAKSDEIAALEKHVAETEAELAGVIKRRTALKESLEKITDALADLSQRKLAAERRVAEYKDMLGRFASLIDAGKLKIRIVDGRMVLTLPMDILFASGSTKLTADGKASLQEVGAGLASVPERRFQIEGHTDNVPIHTARFPSNWELGEGRALVVLRTMLEAGVPAERISAATFGEFRPVASNDDEQGRAANRRIEIVVIPDLSDLPGYDELTKLAGSSG